MKKSFLTGVLFLAVCSAAAQTRPQDGIFSAMRDELARTQKKLHTPGQPKPLFTAFKWVENWSESFSASLGELLSAPVGPTMPQHSVMTHLLVGKGQENSAGFVSSQSYLGEAPLVCSSIPGEYDGARSALWRCADEAYKLELDVFSEKESYKRHKAAQSAGPEFTPAKAARYYEEASCPAPDRARYEQLVKQLSAVGKDYKHVEKSAVFLSVRCRVTRYAQSEGGEYQTALAWTELRFSAQTHNKDGVKTQPSAAYYYEPDSMPSDGELDALAHQFFKSVQDAYAAPKAESYLGPVLFYNSAAANFLQSFTVKASFTKPLLRIQGEDYLTRIGFKDQKGQRVISPLFDVYDKPLLREYNGRRLWGFMPVDDEGVAAQDLQLVKSGKLLALPASRNIPEGEKTGNGHARMGRYMRPRAALTNTFFVPKNPLTVQELEARLLARCRELEQDYCFIVDSADMPGEDMGLSFYKIYTKDGRKEAVYGAKLKSLTNRSFRDISAAGDDMKVFNFQDWLGMYRSIAAPSILVDEVEIGPQEFHPEKPSLVAQPK